MISYIDYLIECPNCRVEYKRTTTWGEIENKFFSREKDNAMKLLIKKQQMKDEVHIDEMTKIEKSIIDKKSGKRILIKDNIEIKEKSLTIEAENEFYNRIRKNYFEKQNRLRILEESIHGNSCTFQPLLSQKKKKVIGKY